MSIRRVSDLIAEAKARIQSVSVKRVAVELRESNVLLVDLREQNERELRGVIPGAIHAPRGMLEFGPIPRSTSIDPNSSRTVASSCTVRSVGARYSRPMRSGAWVTATWPRWKVASRPGRGPDTRSSTHRRQRKPPHREPVRGFDSSRSRRERRSGKRSPRPVRAAPELPVPGPSLDARWTREDEKRRQTTAEPDSRNPPSTRSDARLRATLRNDERPPGTNS
jgi:hypothetical protein